MKLFQRIVFAALLAGLLAGAAMAAIQQWKVVPLILEAEAYETAALNAHELTAPAHDAVAWAPLDGAERIAYTVGADLLASVGFALLLAATAVLSGIEITTRNGVVWGLAGFLAFQLWPALGLPPELPGMPAADLGARQIWWWATALSAAAGFFAIARFRNWTAIGIAAVLLLLPHIVGAPQPPEEPSAVPAHLATAFAAAALATGAVFWLSVGPLLGYFTARFAQSSARRVLA